VRETKPPTFVASLRKSRLDSANEPPPLLHPGMAELYRQKVGDLAQALEHTDTRTEAAEAIRGLLDVIVLVAAEGEVRIELKGNLWQVHLREDLMRCNDEACRGGKGQAEFHGILHCAFLEAL
jgi:hypothetical protein